MVATEIITLHDKLQSLLDREKIAQSPKNYLPIACEFGKELARNQLLNGIKQTIAETGKLGFARSPELKAKAFVERNTAKNLLLLYKDTVPALSIYLQEYEDIEKTSQPMSWDQAYGLDYVLWKACFLIGNDRSADHSVILKQLITFGENGQIIGYIFSQSLNEWQYYLALIEQNKKTALWYSVHYLIRLHELNDIEGRLKKRYALLQDNQRFALYCFDLDTQNFDKALEQYDVQKARSLDFDIEECKMHLHQVWEFIKPKLLLQAKDNQITEIANDSYDESSGILIVRGIPVPFQRDSLRGKILGLLFPNGIAIKGELPFDVIYENAIATRADPSWYKLSDQEKEMFKKKIYEAYEGINERIEKKIKIKIEYLKSANTTLRIGNNTMPL
jgi:hypothetical protein